MTSPRGQVVAFPKKSLKISSRRLTDLAEMKQLLQSSWSLYGSKKQRLEEFRRNILRLEKVVAAEESRLERDMAALADIVE